MTLPNDRLLMEWLAEDPEQGPPEPLERALDATRRTRKRPRWTFPERWVPMQLILQRPATSRAFVPLAILALLLVAVAATALYIGSQRLQEPLGLATNGVIAYDAGGQLYLTDADGTNARSLGQLGTYAYSPAYSPDGTRLAYWSSDSPGRIDLQLIVAAADGSGATQVSTVPFNGATTFAPVWSPDGTLLAYADRGGALRVVAADGTSDDAIAIGWSPTWSPDGAWIAFRGDTSAAAELRVIRPDGTDERPLATGDRQSDAFATMRWTPDSTQIVYHAGGIHTVDLAGTTRQLSTDGGYPTVSPDGRWVSYFVEEAPGVEALNLVELATGETRTLTTIGGCLAVWSPDSTSIITFANGCFTDLALVPIDDPAAAVTLDLPADIGGFPGWQGIPR